MEITAGTIARTICLALALINSVLSATGHPVIDISNETLEAFITHGFLIITSLLAWWKNNSFTMPARIGDFHMRKARREAEEDRRFQNGE